MRKLLPFLIAACSVIAAPGAATEDSIPLATHQALQDARARWLAVAPDDYAFSGHCGGWIVHKKSSDTWTITVMDGRVARSRKYDGMLNLREPPTMAQIFDAIEALLESKKYSEGTVLVKVEFDAQSGYPRRIYVEDTDMEDSWEQCSIKTVRFAARH